MPVERHQNHTARERAPRDLDGRAWPWPAGITLALAAYTVLSIGGWGYFFYRLVPTIWHRALESPEQVLAVMQELTLEGLPALGGLLVSTFLLVISSLMIRQLVLRTVHLIGSSVRFS